MSSKTHRHKKRNWEKANDSVAPSRERATRQKIEGSNEGADLDLLSKVASCSDKKNRVAAGKTDQGSVYEEIKLEDFTHEATTEEKAEISQGVVDKNYTTFPDRLMELLNSDEEAIKKAVWWLPNGDAFAISPAHFNGKILSRFFRGIRFAQVLQKLSRWGFRRIRDVKVTGAHVYSHNLFRRGQPVLFKKYEAARLKPSKSSEVAVVDQDPTAFLAFGGDIAKAANKDQAESTDQLPIKNPVAPVDKGATKERESAIKMIKEAEMSLSFPERLMELLESNEDNVKKAIWWLPEGDTFAISPNHFSEQILSKYFQGSQFGSFIRKLNRWGFKKTLDDKLPFICYYHEFFKRGMPHLCRQIHSGKKGNLKQNSPAARLPPATQATPAPVANPNPPQQLQQYLASPDPPQQLQQLLSNPNPPQQLQQLLASASATPVLPNVTSSTLLGSSLLTPDSILLSQMIQLQQQQQQQQQQQFAAANALAQQRFSDLLAISQLDATRNLQLTGGLQSFLNPNSNINTAATLQSLLSLSSDPLTLALLQQQQQQQQQRNAILQGGGLSSSLQSQILLAQAIQAAQREKGPLDFTNPR